MSERGRGAERAMLKPHIISSALCQSVSLPFVFGRETDYVMPEQRQVNYKLLFSVALFSYVGLIYYQ